MQVHLRKAQAGSASNGYTWPEDGSVVAVEPHHADELLRIGGFEVVDPTDLDDEADDSDDGEFDEVDRGDTATDQPVKRKPGRPRKNPLPN